jgi:rare lipoprotein A
MANFSWTAARRIVHNAAFPGEAVCLKTESRLDMAGKMEKVFLAAACLCLLAGCGSGGGAYYKNDGPAATNPSDLDRIPDARPRLEPLSRSANRPYVVFGKHYVPNTTLKPMRQRGIASWYGKKFHGQKTSSGEPYDMFAMTAAHPTLALPSYVRVTHLDNGKSVVVRVIDRGPFVAGRIIDLSYAAAHRLGYINEGSAPVEVEALLPAELHAKSAPIDESNRLFLQLGAFSNASNAENLRNHLAYELGWLNESIWIQPGDKMYRVQIGPYANRAAAEKIAGKIHSALGIWPGFVVR